MMHHIERLDVNDLYLSTLKRVFREGTLSSPRGMETAELSPAVFVLQDPRRNLVTIPERKLETRLGVLEALMLVTGTSDVKLLCAVAPRYARYVNPETRKLDGAYGPRVGPQLSYTEELLHRDPDTRQAVVTIYSGGLDQHESLDVPCTVSLQFLVRDGKLNTVTYMRSNDMWYGMPYDIFQFTIFQRVLAARLDLVPGTYTHVVGTSHLYARDVTKAFRVVFGIGSGPDPSTPDPSVYFIEHAVRVLDRARRLLIGGYAWLADPTLDDLATWCWEQFRPEEG